MSHLGKRAPNAIDLTGDDDENIPPGKFPRFSSSQSAGPSGSQPRSSQSLSQRGSWGGLDDESEQDQVMDLSQDVDEGAGWLCVGAIDAKIVGLRYYSGFASVGEVVVR